MSLGILRRSFYQKVTAEATSFTKAYDFGFQATSAMIVNDGAAAVEFSWGGRNADAVIQVDGEVKAGEKLEFPGLSEGQVFVRSVAGGELVRVFAWGKDR